MDRLTVRHVRTSRTARVAALGAEVARPEELWVVLHGYRQLADRFLGRFASLDDGRRRIVAPEALSRFYVDEDGGPHGPEHRVGASWMTRHEREAEIEDQRAYLDRVVAEERARGAGGARLVVLGFSQGAHTAARWVVGGDGAVPDALVLWGTGLPHDTDAARAPARMGAARLVLVAGRRDPLWRAEAQERDVRLLAEWGLDPVRLEFDGGHRVEAEPLRRVAAAVSG